MLFRASNIEGRNALIGITIPLLVNLHARIRVGRKINQMGHGRPVRCHTRHIGLREDLAFNFLEKLALNSRTDVVWNTLITVWLKLSGTNKCLDVDAPDKIL